MEGKPVRPSAAVPIRKWHIVLVACVLGIVAAVVYGNRRRDVPVNVVSPTYGDLESTISTVGTAVPLSEFPARANFSGMVEKISVHLGEKVHPGQLLVTMKDQYALSRVESAKAQLESAQVGEENVLRNGSAEDRITFAADRAKAQMEQKSASTALATMKELAAKGSVSPAEVDAAERRLEAANSTLQAMDERDKKRYSPEDTESWKTKVDAAKTALDAEKVTYSNANITSPIFGTVYALPIAKYDFVPMGGDLLRVADLTHVQVHADFDEPDIAKLREGEPAKITWEGRPGYSWHGRVVNAPLAVTVTGPRSVGQCTIAVDDANGDLPADSHVTVVVTIGTRKHVLTIPREALRIDGQNRYVYRVVDGRIEATPVKVGLVDLFRAEITSGLKPQDVLATRAVHGEVLAKGLHVAPEH